MFIKQNKQLLYVGVHSRICLSLIRVQVYSSGCPRICTSVARRTPEEGRTGWYSRKGRRKRLLDEVLVVLTYPYISHLLIWGIGVMRVIITARVSLAETYQALLNRLVAILGVISKNPSNPNFDQYIFESISALIRYGSLSLAHRVSLKYVSSLAS